MLKIKMGVTIFNWSSLFSVHHQSIINQVLKNRQSSIGLKNKQVMRKISFVLVAAMLLTAGSSFANNNPTKKEEPSKSLTVQISELLANSNFTEEEDGQQAQVLFMLNGEKQIVVLSVDTVDDSALERYIKSRLNYQEVDLANYEEGKKYTVSVRVVI